MTQTTLTPDIAAFGQECDRQAASWAVSGSDDRENETLHQSRKGLHPLAERCRDLTKQIDLAAKLCRRVVDVAVKELNARESDHWRNGEINKTRKLIEEMRSSAVEALRLTRYFVKQADWLQDRFPDAQLCAVKGLVKVVTREEIKAADWSLTPGRHVGVAPEEIDENFDFEEAVRSILLDLQGLNDEAVGLAARIARSLEELL